MKFDPFDSDISDYDNWYEENDKIYQSEINAISSLIDKSNGIEIGCGTGRFSVPLGINFCVELSNKMCNISKNNGIKVIKGDTLYLPLKDNIVDFVLFCTTLCFVSDPNKTIMNVRRVLKKDGFVLIAIIDSESFLGKAYQKKKESNKYYKYANFFSTNDVIKLLLKYGFGDFQIVQTLFDFDNKLYDVRSGYGDGGFVVIKAYKDGSDL